MKTTRAVTCDRGAPAAGLARGAGEAHSGFEAAIRASAQKGGGAAPAVWVETARVAARGQRTPRLPLWPGRRCTVMRMDPRERRAGFLSRLHQPGGDRQFPGFRMLHFKSPVPCHHMLRTLGTPACPCPVHMAPQQSVGFPPPREYDLHEVPQESGVTPDCLFAQGGRERNRHVGLNDVVLRTDQFKHRLAERRFPQDPWLSGWPSPAGRLEGPTTPLEMGLNLRPADPQAGCGGGFAGGRVRDHVGLFGLLRSRRRSGSRSCPGSAADASHDYSQGEVSQGCHRENPPKWKGEGGPSSGGSLRASTNVVNGSTSGCSPAGLAFPFLNRARHGTGRRCPSGHGFRGVHDAPRRIVR